MAKAANSKAIFLENLTWPQAEKVMKQISCAVIPIGARTKEHGLHLPLNNDWIMAEYLAKRVAQAAKVIMLPTIPYGFYPAFVEYPGSVNINMNAFKETLIDICRSLTKHGIKRCYFLNTGISTNWSLEPARQELAKENISMEYLNLRVAGKSVEHKVRTQSAGTHADEIETSMMLYIAPKIVKMKLAKADIHEGKGPLTRDPNATSGLYSPTGAWGDPTRATRAKGKIVTEAVVSEILAFLKTYSQDSYVAEAPRTEYLSR
jgi:creatinine amidohydrolase